MLCRVHPDGAARCDDPPDDRAKSEGSSGSVDITKAAFDLWSRPGNRHRQPGQPKVLIQAATARPISSGESSWTKWIPLTVTSVCAGKLRACSRTLPPARIPPGSAFRNSLGTLLVFSQSAYA